MFVCGMAALISPKSHFYQICTYLFFKGYTIKEKSNLKFVFYITLLQSIKIFQYKTKLILSVLQQLKSVEFKKKSHTNRQQQQYPE
jgi:hypothetical protein